MQFQETKAREIKLMENGKNESSLYPSKLFQTLFKYKQTFCNYKSEEEEHVHRANSFTSSDVPIIKVEKALSSSPSVDESGGFQDFFTPPEQPSRKSSHTLSVYAETSLAVPIGEIAAQSKTSVTLNIPSPTAGFFAFSSSNSVSRKNYTAGKTEVSASTTVSAKIYPQHVRGNTKDKDTEPSKESKEDPKPTVLQKDKELLKYRRFSEPARVTLARTRSPGVTTNNPSQLFYEEVGNFNQIEINLEMVNIDVYSLERNMEKAGTGKEGTPFRNVALDRQIDERQPEHSSGGGLKRPSLNRRLISTQSEDDMFESLFNSRQSATYDVTANHGAWHRLRTLCKKITETKQFTFLIMSAILLNMICMGLEHYGQVRVGHFFLKSHINCPYSKLVSIIKISKGSTRSMGKFDWITCAHEIM